MSGTPTEIANLTPHKPTPTDWVPYYTGAVTAVGACLTAYAFTQMPADWGALSLFALAAALTELTSTELYINSRSRVSVSTIIAVAAIVVLGPAAGALTYLSSGIMTVVTTSLIQQQKLKPGERVAWWQRTAFNTSMWVIAAMVAGYIYSWTGGTPGEPLRWGNLLPFILTVTVDTLINLTLLIGVISLQTKRTVLSIWQQDFRWSVPIALLGGIVGGGGLAVGFATLGAGGLAVFMVPVLATGYAFRTYVADTRHHVNLLEVLNQKLATMNTTLEQSNMELLQTLGAVIDAFDIYTYGHSTQVAVYGRAIAEAMSLSTEAQEKILRGGLIHDIGKIGVKDTIIGKPGRLTDEEYELMKRHTVIGAEIVTKMTGLHELVPLVRSHHERWDGRGYPDGLQGEAIPLEARILAVADSVDAMLSDRPYRATRSVADVVKEVIRCAGAHYDPTVVKAFLAVYEARGVEFFQNSASKVDRALANAGIVKPEEDIRYLKKSMLPTPVPNSSITISHPPPGL